MTRLVVVLVALACAGRVLLYAQDLQTPVPTFRSSVEAVQLSVVVTDEDDRPVAGLTADDFEVFEGGLPRPLSAFSAVDIPIERAERTTAGVDVASNDRPPGRTYLIALDEMSAENALRTRHFLREFIDRYFGPNDTAAIALTTRGLRESGQDFTSNPRLLLDALDRFTGGDTMEFVDASGREQGIHTRERNFMGDLRGLMQAFATVRAGRKAMILVSERLPRDNDPYRLVGYRPARFFGSLFSDIHPDFHRAVSLATRHSIAIYPVDPSGLTTEFGGVDGLEAQTDLRALAEITGGFALTGSNSYSAAFERLVTENSTYYVLGFDAADERRDGRYVPIEVRVRRSDLRVRAIDGYLAPRGRPDAPRTPGSVLAAVWDAVASPTTTNGVPMRVTATPFRGTGRSATVAITLDLDATKLALRELDGAYRGDLEILLATTDARKQRYPIFRHRANVALKPETYARISRSSLRVLSQLQLPEGRYQVRISAGGSGVAGSVIHDLEIPDFRRDLSMSGIALSSLDAGDTFTVSPHASLDAPIPWTPATTREFARGDTLLLFAQVYENRTKAHTVTFTADLRGESGRSAGTYATERRSVERPTDVSVYTFEPNLHLDDVGPGRYSLHVEARSSLDARRVVSRDIPIVVR